MKKNVKKWFFIFFELLLSFSLIIPCVNFSVISASSLSSYDLREYGYVTEVKNQGNANTCWLFSAIGAIESSLIVGGFSDSSIDLSEAHLGWFATNSLTNDSMTVGDGCTSLNPYQSMGNDLYIIWALSKGCGLELEKYAPYDTEFINDTIFRETERYISEFTVTETNIFEKTEIDGIKKAIVSNGALMASYYDSSSNYSQSIDGYCFYDNLHESTNHATLIVGWDDNFSRENFGTSKPLSDGAWLCRNSRGESWGDGGYFWISYETLSLKRIVSFKAKPIDSEVHKIYQYDGFGFSKTLSLNDSGAIYSSNVFECTENSILKKIAFYTTMDNLENEIFVYALDNNYSSPIDGTLISTFTKSTAKNGYYLVELPSEVELKQEQSFSIVIRSKGEGRIKVYSEGTENRYSENSKSYLSPDGIKWIDTAEAGYGNLCIKAWTTKESKNRYNIEQIYGQLLTIKENYPEDKKLDTVIKSANNVLNSTTVERNVFNTFFRLSALYDKYFNYTTIANEEQFITFSQNVNLGNRFSDTLVVLTNDLDFSSIEYSPPQNFSGVFNGNGHTIKGIELSSQADTGLFLNLFPKGIIKNVVLSDCTFTSSNYAGGITANNQGLITDCSVKANISSTNYTGGGIAGKNQGTIKNCASLLINAKTNCGGIVGNNINGCVTNCISDTQPLITFGQIVKDSYLAEKQNNIHILKGENIDFSTVKNLLLLYGNVAENCAEYAYTGLLINNSVIIVLGDTDCDGCLSSTDYLKIKSYFCGTLFMDEYQKIAADVNADGYIETTDYLLIKYHFLNLTDIYGVK